MVLPKMIQVLVVVLLLVLVALVHNQGCVEVTVGLGQLGNIGTIQVECIDKFSQIGPIRNTIKCSLETHVLKLLIC